MYSHVEEPGLGVLPLAAAGAAATAVKGVTSVIGGLFGGNSKDPGRLAANAKAYGDAVSGNGSATQYLKGRTGRYGLVPVAPPWSGDPISPVGGWATSKAKDDAYGLYQQVTAAQAVGAGVAPVPVPASSGYTAASVLPSMAPAGINPLLIGGALLTLALLAK